MAIGFGPMAVGANEALQELLARRFLQQMTERKQAEVERRNKTEELMRSQDLEERRKERLATHQDLEQQRRTRTALQSFSGLGIGGRVSPDEYAHTYAGTPVAGGFTPEQTLPSTQLTGGLAPIGSQLPMALLRQASAPQSTGAMLSQGTPAEQETARRDARQRQLDAAKEAKEALAVSGESPADIRQGKAFAAAEARLREGQTFQEKEAGRKIMTERVDKPFDEAHAQAELLRDIVSSAKSGNKFSASQQTVEAALATIRQAGLSRLPVAETAAAKSAGSAWDRLQGLFGQWTKGQPVDEDLQNAMLDYADVLDKAAHRRYLQSHATIKTRYGLSDEVPRPAPTPPPRPSTAPPQGKPYLRGQPIMRQP